jgi:MinD-like ATPase involved in chromosome partitioning or flagellar assembly
VTTNNDTPQIFSEGARDDDPFGREWHDETDGAAFPDEAGFPDDARFPDDAGFPDEAGFTDGPAGAGWYGPWFGWEAEAGGGYPQPPLYPGHPDYRPEPEYPRGPGYAPLPPDDPGPGELDYPLGRGYAPDVGYPQDLGYPHDDRTGPDPLGPLGPLGPLDPLDSGYGYPPDPGYPPDARQAPDPRYWGYVPQPGYGHDADAIPPMKSLLDVGPAFAEYRAGQAPWPGAGPAARPEPGFAGPGGRMPPSRSAAQAPAETSESLTAGSLLHGKRSASGSGWRHRIYRVTGGLLRLGESAADMRRRDLINRVRTPVAGGHHRVAVLSLKGGVGKTTTAVGLGATFATLRGDRVIAVDANPDRGTLSDKVCLETAATIRDLLNERDQIRRYADVRAFTTQAPSRLEVLASDRDPAVSVAFSADDYCDAARVLEHFYSICLTDCGTGLLHSAVSGVLRLADQIVVVSSPSVDGARSASATLDWLEAHNCGDLVRNGVVVLSVIRPKSKSTVDLDRLEHHFAARCRAVARIPYDPHLEEGAEVDLELLSAETADAYLALTALVGDGLAWPRRLTSRSGLP